MSSELAITVDNVSKCFHIYDRPQNRLKQAILPRMQRILNWRERTYFREFWAVQPISFDVRKGETVGVIGRNGSGKSTLLQMICGTLTPSTGTITTNGRIGALLELGSGFNPEFSGRDNVYMNAALLGLSRPEIDAKLDSIVRFAEIGDFIDEPVKTYSSGMMVRLAFAVQSQIDPDILIVDEALAVGDAKFQAKCFDRLKKLKEGGTSILLVTHSSEQIVTHCDRAILLDGGHMLSYDSPRTVVNKYLDLLFSKTDEVATDGSPEATTPPLASPLTDTPPAERDDLVCDGIDRYSTRPNYNPSEYRWGDSAAQITDFLLRAGSQHYPNHIENGQPISLSVSLVFHQSIRNPIVGFTIKNKEGVTIYGCNTESIGVFPIGTIVQAGQTFSVTIDLITRLGAGDYFLSTGIASRQGDDLLPHDRRYDSIHLHVLSQNSFHGLIDLGAAIRTSLS